MVKEIDTEIESLYWNTAQEEDITDQGDFGNYYAHLESVFTASVKAGQGKNGIPELSAEYRTAFYNRMKQITMRTLLFEMELSGDCGELAGEGAEEQYRFFADHFLKDPAYLKGLYEEYPLLYQDMLRCLEMSARNLRELLDRFAQDADGLNERFFRGNPCRRIERIGGGDSDAHRGGRRVHILELDNGEKLVYKPRSLAVDESFGTFLQWSCEGIGADYWRNPVWDRGDYGWCGWVEESPCHSREELKRYYRRNGILLGICYLLGSRDLHYENVIAHGEYPVIIDLEMGIGVREAEANSEGGTGVERVYQESVLRTGILPTYAWDAMGKGIHVGAMNAAGGQLAPFLVPVLVEPGTVRMHVEYRQPVTKQGKNLATLDGAFIRPWEFLGDIEAGFEEVYSFLSENRIQVLWQLELFQGVKIRYLIRQTQEYSMLLTAMYHPDYMTEEEKRDHLLSSRLEGADKEQESRRKWIAAQEEAELRNGDIPYFWYRPEELDLCSGRGGRLKAYFRETALESVRDRLFRMERKDLERQKKWIRTALLMGERSRNVPVPEGDMSNTLSLENVGESKMPGLSVAERIGDFLLEEAVRSDDGKDVGWISILIAGYQEQIYLIRPMGLYLYDGLAGVAVFLQRLGIRTGKPCYGEMAERLIQRLYAHTLAYRDERREADMPTGAFSGEASIAYAYMLLYQAERKPEYLDYLYWQCQAVAAGFAGDRVYDVLGGNGGAILVLLEAYKLTGNRRYIRWAKEAGECLLAAAESFSWGWGWRNPVLQIPLTGFAHGASGMMLALAKLGYYTGEEKFHQAAYQAFLFEEHYYDAEVRDWQDLRGSGSSENQGSQAYKMAWCHGWGGITMARRLAEKYAEGNLKEALCQTADFIREKEGTNELGETYCLCHGNCGNAAMYYGVRNEKGQGLLERAMAGLEEAEDIRTCLGVQECGSFGLMGGITGIGYAGLCGAEECGRLLGVEILDGILDTETGLHTD